jgi:MFS transporter, UMF1 family
MHSSSIPPADKKEILSWCCYDFANSSFTTIIITVIYSTYFTNVVAVNLSSPNFLWALALALSQLLVILLGPWLGAIADRRANKKSFLTALSLLCALFTALLYFTAPGTVWLAFSFIVVANFAFSLGENFCSSFLPEISTPETCGKISGYGWSFGYMGGLVSLGLALLILHLGGNTEPSVVRLTFPATALFFLIAALPTLLYLRERAQPVTHPISHSAPHSPNAFQQLIQSLRRLYLNRTLFHFFLSFFFYMCGLCSIIAFAAIYAQKVIGFDTKQVILLFACLQVSSAIGAFSFGYLQDYLGARFTLILSLLLWIAVCLTAAFSTGKASFFLVGNLAGLVIGSTQSASRAVVSMLTPRGQEGEHFGLWGFFGKLAAVIGPLVFGCFADALDPRWAIAAMTLFFLIGLGLLRTIHLPQKNVLT